MFFFPTPVFVLNKVPFLKLNAVHAIPDHFSYIFPIICTVSYILITDILIILLNNNYKNIFISCLHSYLYDVEIKIKNA